MKLLILACIQAVVSAGELMLGYHGPVGIPAASKIRRQESASRIAGGISAPTGMHPFFAGLLIALTTGQTSVCGGTLLSSKRVLTAAQCWYDGRYQGKSITVVLGTHRLYYGGRRQTVTAVYVHPAYTPFKLANDIAMLAIPANTFNTDVSPIRLPLQSQSNNTYEGIYAHAIGFGKTSDFAPISSDQILQDVALTVISNGECAQMFGNLGAFNNNVICTSGLQGWGACFGDAGGPLIIKSYTTQPDVLIGVISLRSSLGCQSGQPTVYMRITYYLNWINSLL